MRRSIILMLFVLMLLVAMPVSAQVIVPPCCGVFTDPSWLKIDHHRVNVDINNQIATTNVDFKMTNEGDALAEGTFVFPLPHGAAIDELVMWVDGVAITAKILPADEARQIYDEIVRQYRDPALLEYIGQSAVQANIFPIPPGDSRRVEIRYQQVLEIDNGLVHYVYPMHASANSNRTIESMSISVEVSSNDPISNIYSPSHSIAVSRDSDDKWFRAGWERTFVKPGDDFSLFYGLASDTVNVNLLDYKESANEDGFFMLMVQPPLNVDEDALIPKDVVIVLDQSGSMQGPKWDQAREAAAYVLNNLNSRDRFNMVLFSTGARTYSLNMENPDLAGDAINWIDNMYAEGGTDINLALTTALGMASGDRPTTIIFLTDGEATEGEIDTDKILDNLEDAAKRNTRIFTFGVGDDVNTVLLDSIVRDFKGTGSYVRPTERIDEEVASLYNKISAPVLTNPQLDFGDVRIDWMYPAELPDLFAGEQLTVVGRYRDATDNLKIELSGVVGNENITYVYDDLSLRSRAGGEPFIARLWATRRIGELLNNIRLNGEDPELVDSIVSLSVRYGIITPYTSFLIEEDDILSQTGRDRATDAFREEAQGLTEAESGEAAVDAADALGNMSNAQAPNEPLQLMPTASPQGTMPATGGMDANANKDADGEGYGDDGRFDQVVNPIQTIGGKTFLLQNDVWTDTLFEPDNMTTQEVVFLSDEYFDLLDTVPDIAQYLTLGDHIIVVIDGTAYEIVPE